MARIIECKTHGTSTMSTSLGCDQCVTDWMRSGGTMD